MKTITKFGLQLVMSSMLSLGVVVVNGYADEDQAQDKIPCDETAIKALKPHQKLLHIRGMVCGMCVQGITKTVGTLAGVTNIEINLEAGSALITLKPGQEIKDEDLKEAIKRAGYELQDIHHGSTDNSVKSIKSVNTSNAPSEKK